MYGCSLFFCCYFVSNLYLGVIGYGGHYTSQGCGGSRVIDHHGTLLSSPNTSTTLYACWRFLEKSIVLDDAGGSGGKLYNVTCDLPEYSSYGGGYTVNMQAWGDWVSFSKGSATISPYWASPCSSSTQITSMYLLPTRSGYVFRGYYTGQNGTGSQWIDATGTLVDADDVYPSLSDSAPMTLYAYWTQQQSAEWVTVSINDQGATTTPDAVVPIPN